MGCLMPKKVIQLKKKFMLNKDSLLGILVVCSLSILVLGETIAQSNLPGKWPDRIVLNPTENPATSLAVSWRTDTTIHNGYCELQPATHTRIDSKKTKQYIAESTNVTFSGDAEPTIYSAHHTVSMTNLNPGTTYIYRVGDDEHWSEWFQFKTHTTDDQAYSFIYFGDPQVSLRSECARVIRKAFMQCPDSEFMFYAGDVVNRAGRDSEWQGFFDAGSFIYATIPQIMTPGNHDYDELTLDTHWNAQLTFPSNGPKGLEGTCYFVDYKNLRFISFDSATDGELENESGYQLTAQKAWLDSILAESPKKWTIVTTHLPFYSPKESRDNVHLRKHFQPILEKHGVDLVLTGHDHSYGRGMVTDTPNTKPAIMYIVSVSGPKLYPAGDKEWMQKSISYTQLYQTITIDDNKLIYKAFDATGKLRDEFRLKKSRTGKNKLVDSNIR